MEEINKDKVSKLLKQWFDPGKGFFELSITRWVGGVGIGLALTAITGYLISAWSLERCWTPVCLNYFFVDLMRVPIGVLAITAAVLALMATHHRSKQFAHQSSITNYYTHLKEFRVYMEGWDPKYLEIVSASILYKRFFPSVLYGETEVCEDLITNYEQDISRVIAELDKLLSTENRSSDWYIEKMTRIIKSAKIGYAAVVSEAVEKKNTAFFSVKPDIFPVPPDFRQDFGAEIQMLYLSTRLVSFVVEFDPYADHSQIDELGKLLDSHRSTLQHGLEYRKKISEDQGLKS